ncbi:MAG: cell wall metabolism sensor histidine kinase WalK, partial [Clostridiales bacterium]|nr:cell wall metabolism sensor histidine kinase WalK [Clostridiales bacterium]
MFRTIFRRQFIVYLGNLLVVFLILSAALFWTVSGYFYNRTEEALTRQSKRISEEYINTYIAHGGFGWVFNPTFENEMNSLYNYLGASFFVAVWYDNGLRLIGWTPNLAKDETRISDIINSAPEYGSSDGKVVTTIGTLNGLFDERMIVVAHPIIFNNGFYGFVFINSPVAEIDESIREVMFIALLCLLSSGLIAFGMIYLSSRTISRPIRQMNDAAKVIAAGSFDRRLNVKTRDEVGQLAESFNFMAESLENQEISRRAFISNISHDLRSPLTSMKGFLQAMLDGTIPQENQEKYLRIVLDETERITKMANDLMFIGKFQNFDLELKLSHFDINELIRTTLITFERRINDKNLDIEVSFADEKSIVEADYEKIHRVIYNLIDNAVKYTGQDGTVIIATAADQRRSNRLKVCVKDNGPGIPAEEQKRIFDRFYKSDLSRGQDKTGSGLGLAIVKEFVQAHGGTVALAS